MSDNERAVRRLAQDISAGIRQLRRERSKLQNRTEQNLQRAKNMGGYWEGARVDGGFHIIEIADLLGIDYVKLRHHEQGIEPEVWEGQLPKNYAEALERPELYPAFCDQFQIPYYQELPTTQNP